MNRPTLPKEVAEAIESFRSRDISNEDIIKNALGLFDNYNEVIYLYTVDHFDEFITALVNGYEVEQTPEEKVREYYEGLKSSEDSLEIAGHDGSQFRQGWQSVEKTLDLLGIKIEGVNA